MPVNLLLALTILVGCASTPPPCPVAPAVTPGPPFLWRVEKQGGGPTVWLFGTIHDAGLDAVPRAARDALATSTRFASELGDNEPDDRDKLRELMRIKSGPGLDQLLPRDDWWDLRDALRDVIREDELRRVRPWYALILLNRRSAPKVVSMDIELAKLARERKLDVDGLETWDAQIAALDSVVTGTDVQQALRARGGMRCEYVGLGAAYASGDLATMERLLVVARTAEPILYARNRAWLPGIERYLASGGAFIAVGLGHLIGEPGLPSVLARAGYVVERVR
jgi:uncharacterized protein YbaP (TraB family)